MSRTVVEAEADLLSNKVFKSLFVKYNVDVLEALCTKYDLAVTPTGRRSSPLKNDYIDALNIYKVSSCIAKCFPVLSAH